MAWEFSVSYAVFSFSTAALVCSLRKQQLKKAREAISTAAKSGIREKQQLKRVEKGDK